MYTGHPSSGWGWPAGPLARRTPAGFAFGLHKTGSRGTESSVTIDLRYGPGPQLRHHDPACREAGLSARASSLTMVRPMEIWTTGASFVVGVAAEAVTDVSIDPGEPQVAESVSSPRADNLRELSYRVLHLPLPPPDLPGYQAGTAFIKILALYQ